MSDLLVSSEWLRERLGATALKVVDGSWFLSDQKRDAHAEFVAGHIPGAVHFDIDAIADRSTGLPHMLPDEATFADAAGKLGLSHTDTIVVYDSVGLFSAPRVWWTLKAFGALDVKVLDGGLPSWKAARLALEVGEARPARAHFKATLQSHIVRDLVAVSAALAADTATVLDARPAERFSGEAPEPRPRVASGHMPGAKNLPYQNLLDADGRLLPPDRLRGVIREAGIDLARPVITSCGSGVTAALLLFALARIGKEDVALYDGSWAEWGARPGAAIVKGFQ
jgi:thiosulfate/3-mercaptopyruvate sulfurtransferase